MRAHGGAEPLFRSYLISTLSEGEWPFSRPGRFTAGKRPWNPSSRRLGRPCFFLLPEIRPTVGKTRNVIPYIFHCDVDIAGAVYNKQYICISLNCAVARLCGRKLHHHARSVTDWKRGQNGKLLVVLQICLVCLERVLSGVGGVV